MSGVTGVFVLGQEELVQQPVHLQQAVPVQHHRAVLDCFQIPNPEARCNGWAKRWRTSTPNFFWK